MAIVLRPTKLQIDSLRSLVVHAVFGKPLANASACFSALGVPLFLTLHVESCIQLQC